MSNIGLWRPSTSTKQGGGKRASVFEHGIRPSISGRCRSCKIGRTLQGEPFCNPCMTAAGMEEAKKPVNQVVGLRYGEGIIVTVKRKRRVKQAPLQYNEVYTTSKDGKLVGMLEQKA